MNQLSRRRLIEDSLLLLTVGAVAPSEVMAAPTSRARRRVMAAEKLRVAVVGVNGQGKSHVGSLCALDDVDIVAICDADTGVVGPALKAIQDADRTAPRVVQDIRKLLEDKDIDAISTATPNHWHALISIWAMQAGKHVYVEKPATHEMLEGPRMVEAARKYNRICQVGTQSRSNPGMRDAIAFIHSGGIGKVTLARGLCYKPRGSIGKTTAAQQPPTSVDYDLWLGPAPKKPVMRRRFHYDWHWFWDYGNGDLGNQGVHEMDKARWGLNKPGLPETALGLGGRFGYQDDGETPNTELIFLDYGDSQLVFEVRGLQTGDLKGAKVGNIWYGDKGYVVAPSYSSATAYDNDGAKIQEFKGGASHHRNWVDAIKSGNYRHLNCDVEEGSVSAALCHLGNISYRLGSLQQFGKRARVLGDDKECVETYARFEEHLSANGLVLSEGVYRVGRKLRIDGRKWSFIGDSEANRLRTRKYRKGYAVPDKV